MANYFKFIRVLSSSLILYHIIFFLRSCEIVTAIATTNPIITSPLVIKPKYSAFSGILFVTSLRITANIVKTTKTPNP